MMEKIKEINCKEYKFKRGDLVVTAMYGENGSIKKIGFDCAKSGCNIVIFNLRQLFREELEQKLLDATEMKGILYIDYALEDEKETTIERIKDVCNYVINEFGRFYMIIDFPNANDYKEDYIKQLKQLAEDLKIVIIVNADIEQTDASPSLSDLNNKALENIADVVVVGTDEQSTMVKNKYGKTGILVKEDDNNEC